MSNRQKQRGNNRNGMNPANAEPIQLEEAEDLEVSTEDSPSIEEVVNTLLTISFYQMLLRKSTILL